MGRELLHLLRKLQVIVLQTEGQDLVEYALVVALVALGATAGMNTLASYINNAFSTVGATLNNSI